MEAVLSTAITKLRAAEKEASETGIWIDEKLRKACANNVDLLKILNEYGQKKGQRKIEKWK